MALGPQALTAISSGFPSLSPQVSSGDGGSRRGSWPERHVLLLLVKNSTLGPCPGARDSLQTQRLRLGLAGRGAAVSGHRYLQF